MICLVFLNTLYLRKEPTDFTFSEEKVKKILKSLQTGNALGPDGINPLFLAKR